MLDLYEEIGRGRSIGSLMAESRGLLKEAYREDGVNRGSVVIAANFMRLIVCMSLSVREQCYRMLLPCNQLVPFSD